MHIKKVFTGTMDMVALEIRDWLQSQTQKNEWHEDKYETDMKNITIDGVEYTPIVKKEWTKHEIKAKTLEWGPVAKDEMTWEDAGKWCEEQGGRLPTSLELFQAYHDRVGGFLPAYDFWSATTYPSTGVQYSAMRINCYDGSVYASSKTSSYYVRCVRG